jgi:hypothetical protein
MSTTAPAPATSPVPDPAVLDRAVAAMGAERRVEVEVLESALGRRWRRTSPWVCPMATPVTGSADVRASAGWLDDLDHHGLADLARALEHAQRQPAGDLGPVVRKQGMESHSCYLSGTQHILFFDQERPVVHVRVHLGREAPARSVARVDRPLASALLGGQKSQARADEAMLPPMRLPANQVAFVHGATLSRSALICRDACGSDSM